MYCAAFILLMFFENGCPCPWFSWRARCLWQPGVAGGGICFNSSCSHGKQLWFWGQWGSILLEVHKPFHDLLLSLILKVVCTGGIPHTGFSPLYSRRWLWNIRDCIMWQPVATCGKFAASFPTEVSRCCFAFLHWHSSPQSRAPLGSACKGCVRESCRAVQKERIFYSLLQCGTK